MKTKLKTSMTRSLTKIIEDETFHCYVPLKKPSSGPAEYYETCSKGEKLMKYHIKTSVDFSTNLIVTEIVEETIEDRFTLGYDKRRNENINHKTYARCFD